MRKPATITTEQRERLAEAVVTLDGKPAKVYGVALAFARVGLLSGGPSVEFSWATVARVVAAGGAFKS